jgi:putative LysE/RhtB family amino acid efflux pump
MSGLLFYFLLGVLIGAATGIPIGPVNVAVIDAAYRHNVKRAVAVAFGGASADLVYALIGIVGLGPILVRHPNVPPILYAISGVVLIIYGILTVRAQAVDPAPAGTPTANTARHLWGGFMLGVGLIFLNPATLVTWVVIVGSAMAGVTHAEGVAAAVGIGVGSLGWFTLVAYLADHGKKVLGKKAIWITRVVGMALIGYGIFSIGRAVHYLVTKVL